MTLAIVVGCALLYMGLAIVIGRFCGVNSAWERVVDHAMHEKAHSSADADSSPVPLEEPEEILRSPGCKAREKETVVHAV